MLSLDYICTCTYVVEPINAESLTLTKVLEGPTAWNQDWYVHVTYGGN
jgi:hypothetical protein